MGRSKKLTAVDEFWHELVLAGVGGRTVEEAKESMSYDEFVSWTAYVRKNGGLNLGVRAEDGFAMLASVLCQLNGKRHTAADFKPKRTTEAEEQQASLQAVLNMLKTKARENTRQRVKARRKQKV